MTTDVKIIYTEQAADAFEVARAQFETAGGGTFYVRWVPRSVASASRYSTGAGFLRSFTYPPVDAEEDGPMQVTFTVQHAAVVKDTSVAVPSTSVSPSISASPSL